MENQTIKDTVGLISQGVQTYQRQYQNLVVGRIVKIISDFNGQPYGNSKKNLKDTTFKVIHATIDDGGRCWLHDGDYNHTYIGIDEVEFMEAI